jgi:hypothetical protein
MTETPEHQVGRQTSSDDLPDEAFETRADAHLALSGVVADQGASMSWFSADFRYWPLHDPQFVRALEIWVLRDARRQSALRILAVDWRDMRTRFPRFATFRRDFSHAVECRQIRAALVQDLPEMAWTQSQAVFARTSTWGSGQRISAQKRLAALHDRFEGVWQQAIPAFPANTLGL